MSKQTGVGDIYSDFYAAQQAQNVMQQPQYGQAPAYQWPQASYPDHFHAGYDTYGRPIYRDRYARFHYGSNTGYSPAPPPPAVQPYGLGDAPSAPPPDAPPASAPAAAAPASSAPTAMVVSTPPGGTTTVIPATTATPFYQRAFQAMKLPHPAGAALITAIGAGIGGIAGQKLIPKTGLHLGPTESLAAGAAVGAGIAGGVAAILLEKEAHSQHSDQTGAPSPA